MLKNRVKSAVLIQYIHTTPAIQQKDMVISHTLKIRQEIYDCLYKVFFRHQAKSSL